MEKDKNLQGASCNDLNDTVSVPKQKKSKKRRKKIPIIVKIFICLVMVLILSIVSISVYISIAFDYNYEPITKEPEELGFEEVIEEEVINIALFGVDTRNLASFRGNSDSIMILSVNTHTKKVKIISVMRDTLVPIERNGKITYTKINAAYAYGGPELAIKTLNQNYQLDISEYATVNFEGMMDIIDAVGGIDVTLVEQEVVPATRENKGLNNTIQEACNLLGVDPTPYYITKPGTHHLNGIQAVAYSRIRYVKNVWGTNNDYGRTDRQRYVMEQLFNKAKTLSKSQYIDLAKALLPCTQTSLSYSEIMSIAFRIMFDSPTFEQARVPLNEKDKNFLMPAPSGNFGSVAYYDLNYASKIIHSFIYDNVSFDEYIAANPIEKNDWYTQAISGT